MKVIQKNSLNFNSAKCVICQTHIALYGCLFTRHVIKYNPAKVQSTTNMQSPTDVQQLKIFLGIINFMQTSVHHMSQYTDILREQLKHNNILLGIRLPTEPFSSNTSNGLSFQQPPR